MSAKSVLFAILLIAGLQAVYGQQIEFRSKIGIGTYSMADLKGLLKQSVSSSPIGLKTTENFPAYVFYGLDVVHLVSPKFGFGISSGFYSTGGRNHIADYSGSYRDDIMVKAVNLGLLVSFKDTLTSHFFYGIELGSGIKFSDISSENELDLLGHNERNDYDFRSKGWWIEPQLRFGRTFLNKFTCMAFAGYEFNLKSKLKPKGNEQYSSVAKIDWSGIRAGVSISYKLDY